MKRIIKRIKKKIAHSLIREINNIQKKESLKKFNLIKNMGKDTFFWGDKITISDPEKITLGQNVHIGDNAYIKSEGGLTVGDNTHISRNLTLYTVNHNYKSNVLPYNHELIYKEVIIGKNVWIGMNVCITPGTVIGDGAIIGMGTVVSGNIPSLSIIGSEKWKILHKRDKSLYDDIVSKGRYGKENGLLYSNEELTLNKVGDKIIKKRSILEYINYKNQLVVKKTYDNSNDGIKSLDNESKMYSLFKNYDWLPKIIDKGEDYILLEYIDNKYRLDNYILGVDNIEEKNNLLGEILLCLLDIYGENIAHCDFHSKNIFCTPNGIKIIDFETSQELNTGVDFFNSYDITGEFLESPHLTRNMCVLNERNFSLKKIFNISDKTHLEELFHSNLLLRLYEISGSFFTRKKKVDDRHVLINKYIYSTFDLKYLKVENKIGQRDIKKRLRKFKVSEKNISGKEILDIGSNIGGVIFEIAKMNPIRVLGIEYDIDKVEISRKIKSLNYKEEHIDFERVDVEGQYFKNEFNYTFDTVFCLAVIDHLKEKESFFRKLGNICKETLFFEGNSKTDKEFVIDQLKSNGFQTVDFIGLSDDELNENNNNRPLFIAVK